MEQRVLLIVNSLARHGDGRLKKLYRFIELAGVDTAVRFLSAHYRQIYVMRDSQAGCMEFIEKLRSISGNRQNEAVDLFLQLHGLPGQLQFFDQQVLTSDLAGWISETLGNNCLRLLYNTSCYGDSHSEDFLQAGFRAAVGSLKINASAATEYPVFCRLWGGAGFFRKNNITVKDLLAKADLAGPRWISDRLAGRYFKEVDSRKIIRGDARLTISS